MAEQDKIKNLEGVVQTALESLTSGVPLAQQGKIPPEKIEALYALGANYYAQKDFVKAEEIFSLAFPLDFLHSRIVLGLAAARKMQGKFDDALKAYALAAMLDIENPEPSFYAAECFFALDRVKECLQALDAALGLAEGEEQHQSLIDKIHKMKNNLPQPATD